jgi:hypothetical protein
MLKLAIILLFPFTAAAQNWPAETVRVEKAYQIPPGLLQAIIAVESSYRPTAINDVGGGTAIVSYGIGQLTADSLQTCAIDFKDRFDGHKGLRCAGRLLRGLLLKYHNSEAAISGYNDGTPCVCEKGKWVVYASTKKCPLPQRRVCDKTLEGDWRNQKYVNLVLDKMH